MSLQYLKMLVLDVIPLFLANFCQEFLCFESSSSCFSMRNCDFIACTLRFFACLSSGVSDGCGMRDLGMTNSFFSGSLIAERLPPAGGDIFNESEIV